MAKITVFDHPLIQHKISILRSKETDRKDFRELVSEITMFMSYEALRDLPLNREISAKSSFLVMVEYTRQDGSKKVFILNYAAYDASVTYEGTVYDIPVGGFAVIDR